jgi:hypothetical protein
MTTHRKNILVYLALGLSFLTCLRVLWIQHGWIANDSMLYFEMARHFSAGEFKKAFAVEGFTWGLYPGLIALVHVLSGLSLQASANLLIVLFFMLIVGGLMRMVSIAGGNEHMQSYALFLLLGAGYIVGDVLPMASRDLGYWAMIIHAINQLILFYQHGRWRSALNWQGLALLAMLFRIEGAVHLLVLPLVGFFISSTASSTLQRIVMPYVLLIFAALLSPLVVLLGHINLDDLGRVKELVTGLSDIKANVEQNLVRRVEVMHIHVIGDPFREYAWFTFLLAYFSITTLKCLSVAGWAPTLLAWAERRTVKKSVQPVAYRVLFFWLIISWLIGCLITFKVNLLSPRYVALFGFVLIVFASFALYRLLHQKTTISLAKKLLLGFTALIVIAGFISNVKPKHESFYYEIDAVHYVQDRLNPGEQALYTSAKQRFYAGAPFDTRFDYDWTDLQKRIEDGNIRQYRYISIKSDIYPAEQSRLSDLNLQSHGFQLEKTFSGHKNKKLVLIFRRKN